MKKIHNKFLIISGIVVLISTTFLYFSSGIDSSTIIPIAYSSSLTDTTDGETKDVSLVESKILDDIAFLTTLISLKQIKIDNTIFSNKGFNSLKNNAVSIEKIPAGRINPFAPVEGKIANSSSYYPKAITNGATQITSNSVILNGTLNAVSEASDAYFVYGPTYDLGSTTSKVKQSLAGTIIKNVLGLKAKTKYFYKACTKIDNTELCGEILSFTTN